MRILKNAAACLLTAALAAMLPFSASAATGNKISSISLRIDSEIVAGDSGSDVDVTNEPRDEWEDGDKPKLKVTLTAAEDYYFPTSGLTKSDVSLSGDDGTVTSVSRSSSDTFRVYITLEALDDDDDDDSDYELDVDGLEWDESDGTAYWNDGEDAKRYEVRLYRGDSTASSILSTSDTSYDFSSYFTQSGTYTFRVRGVAEGRRGLVVLQRGSQLYGQ